VLNEHNFIKKGSEIAKLNNYLKISEIAQYVANDNTQNKQ